MPNKVNHRIGRLRKLRWCSCRNARNCADVAQRLQIAHPRLSARDANARILMGLIKSRDLEKVSGGDLEPRTIETTNQEDHPTQPAPRIDEGAMRMSPGSAIIHTPSSSGISDRIPLRGAARKVHLRAEYRTEISYQRARKVPQLVGA